MSPRLLIVDPDPIARGLTEQATRRLNYATETAAGGASALERLASEGLPPIDLLLLDLATSDSDALALVAKLAGDAFAPPVIALAPREDAAAFAAGAADLVVKPPKPERLKFAIANALRAAALDAELRRLAGASGFDAGGCGLALTDAQGIGSSMRRTLRLAERAAKSPLPVLIEGEAGAGKQTLARAIHNASDRRGRSFVILRCGLARDAGAGAWDAGAADPETLLRAEAAPGGAWRGRLAQAHGGTLFIADVWKASPELQAKLLRLVADGEVRFPGASPLRLDVRIICSSRRSLIEQVKAGRFREDLFYRLNMHALAVPPLRLRREEIEPLARRFCARFASEAGRFSRGLTAEAAALLCDFDWPGNVRQLESVMLRAVSLAHAPELTLLDFPQIARIAEDPAARQPAALAFPDESAPDGPHQSFDGPGLREAFDPPDWNSLPLLGENGDMRTLAALEAEAIRFAFERYRGRMAEMARKLGIGRSTLYRKLKEQGLAALDAAAAGSGGASASEAA